MADADPVEQTRAVRVSLLPGEPDDTNLPDDAAHWATVYEELTGSLLQVQPPDGTRERFRRRLNHWRCRRDELAGSSTADAESSAAGE